MEPQKTLYTMDKDLKVTTKKQDTATTIELVWENKQDLIDLSNEDVFTSFILKESYKTIERAISTNLSKVELFNIFNLSIIVEVEKTNYSSILEKVMVLFLEEENYEECSKIKKLIKKIDEKI
jgi:transposase|tara:strand:- start:653 stop:1021 length:369 start_codon:yes stop_codon:yes gene_type:complete